MDQHEHQTNRQTTHRRCGLLGGRSHDHNEEHGRHDNLGDERCSKRCARRGKVSVPVRREVAGGLTTGHQEDQERSTEPAENLRNDVRACLSGGEPAAGDQASSNSRVEVATADVTERVGPGHDRKTERQTDPNETEPETRAVVARAKVSCEHRRAATAKHQSECADEFGNKCLDIHEFSPSVFESSKFF